MTAVAKPVWKKVRPFGRAIAYMISKSESEKPQNADLHDIVVQACEQLDDEDVQSVVESLPSCKCIVSYGGMYTNMSYSVSAVRDPQCVARHPRSRDEDAPR